MGLRPGRRRLDAAVAAGHRRRARDGDAGRLDRPTVLVRGLGAAPGRRERAGLRARRARRRRQAPRRRRARHAHDRARLGAADAPGGGDRHRLGRHDLPRRDRLARARHPLRRRHRRGDASACATASSSPSTRRAALSSRAPSRRSHAVAGACGRARRRQAPHRRPAQLLVNLSEPSQVERAAALDVDGVGLLRAELMVIEALEGDHPRLLLEQGRTDEFVERMAERPDDVRRRVRAAAGHLPDDRLPHERVPRPARAASASSPRRPTR